MCEYEIPARAFSSVSPYGICQREIHVSKVIGAQCLELLGLVLLPHLHQEHQQKGFWARSSIRPHVEFLICIPIEGDIHLSPENSASLISQAPKHKNGRTRGEYGLS